ncbi:MAG: metallophosphoesterase [Candidatus Aenigmatarchaeota archaeon]
MKILVLGDLHGSKPKIHFEGFDLIIAPGNFCSYDKIRKYEFEVIRKRQKYHDFKLKWYELIGKRKAKRLILESLKSGREVLEHINSFNVPVFTVPGNVDFTPYKDSGWNFLEQNHYKMMLSGLKNIKDIHKRIVNHKNYQIVGYGISSGPEKTQHKEDIVRKKPKELKKEERNYNGISKKMSSLFKKASKPVVFLSHNVPFNTRLDKITMKSSPRYGYHYGSLITREMVEKHQPLICIGGHMHEHLGKCKLGKTVCINSGFGSDVNVLLELEGKKIKKINFYRGN